MATHADIRDRLRRELENQGIDAQDIRIQPDPTGGWWIAVVAVGFAGQLPNDRRALIEPALEGIRVSWCDLLTPDEVDDAGSLPADVAPDQLPLWPEALGRAADDDGPVVFASDLDEDIAPPVVATFYSLRGGVGRSTALVQTAQILASRGRRVVAVDMDLEAPGLASLFGVEDQVDDDKGVVAALTKIDFGDADPYLADHLIRVSETDDLFCLPAGRPSALYARRLSQIDPSAWYREERNPLRRLIDLLRRGLPFTPDSVLIDARTGLSALSGPLLFDLPDIAIVVFFPHPQARLGTEALVRALASAHVDRSSDGRSFYPEPRFIASPLPAGESFATYRRRAHEWIADWIAPLNAKRNGYAPLLETEITQPIPYREALATSDRPSAQPRDWQDFQAVADWIDRLIASRGTAGPAVSIAQAKPDILKELDFPTGTAESQKFLLDTFLETETVRKALDPETPLVRGRKGTGKTALFRRLSETAGNAIEILAPADLQADWPWRWGGTEFRDAERLLRAGDSDWRAFWKFFICARAAALGVVSEWPSGFPPSLKDPVPTAAYTVLDQLEGLLGERRHDVRFGEWLRHLDAVSAPHALLLFDGLDAGFGNSPDDRRRRREANEGLIGLLAEQQSVLRQLRFKIVLREDIWRQLKVDNKSHFYGRDAVLMWRDRTDFLRLIVSHALRSERFRSLLQADRKLARSLDTGIGALPEDVIMRAWTALIGERMKGSGSTYTANWVWNRLKDGNEDRNPRYLLMTFREIVEWERREHARTPYERSVIRPRALEQVLPKVSRWALDALAEEFSELQDHVFGALRGQRTPLPTDWPDQTHLSPDLLNLASEVGLISLYEGTPKDPGRYAVPEVYRFALDMKRKGQA